MWKLYDSAKQVDKECVIGVDSFVFTQKDDLLLPRQHSKNDEDIQSSVQKEEPFKKKEHLKKEEQLKKKEQIPSSPYKQNEGENKNESVDLLDLEEE